MLGQYSHPLISEILKRDVEWRSRSNRFVIHCMQHKRSQMEMNASLGFFFPLSSLPWYSRHLSLSCHPLPSTDVLICPPLPSYPSLSIISLPIQKGCSILFSQHCSPFSWTASLPIELNYSLQPLSGICFERFCKLDCEDGFYFSIAWFIGHRCKIKHVKI